MVSPVHGCSRYWPNCPCTDLREKWATFAEVAVVQGPHKLSLGVER